MKNKLTILLLLLFVAGCCFAQNSSSRKVERLIDVSSAGTLSVRTNGEYLELNVWEKPQIKIEISVTDSTAQKLSDDQVLEKHKIVIRSLGSFIEINSGSGIIIKEINGGSNSLNQSGAYNYTGAAGIQAGGIPQFSKSSMQKIIVYYPGSIRLKISSRYSDIKFTSPANDAEIGLYVCNMDAPGFRSLRLNATSSYLNIATIEKGVIDLKNGNFRSGSINEAELDTYAAMVEIEKVKKLYIRSNNDEYTIGEAAIIEGRKSFNSLRLDKITQLLDIAGNNFDLKLRTIAPETELIRIIDQYGNIRLPVRGLKDYVINFKGNYSRVYSTFEMTVEKEIGEKRTHTGMDNAALPDSNNCPNRVYYSNGVFMPGGSPEKFTISVGNTKGRHTSFELSCSSSVIDFN